MPPTSASGKPLPSLSFSDILPEFLRLGQICAPAVMWYLAYLQERLGTPLALGYPGPWELLGWGREERV